MSENFDDSVESTAGATAGDTDPWPTSDGSTSGLASDSASGSASATSPTDTDTGSGTETEGTTAETTGEPESAVPSCAPISEAFAGGVELAIHEVTLELTRNGESYAGSSLDNGYIYLVNEVTGDRALIGQVKTKTLVAPVLAGTYSIVYEAAASTMTMPRNASFVIEKHFTVFGNVSHPVDIPSVDFTFTLEVDGAEPTKSPVDSARIFVTEGGHEGPRTYLGSTAQSGGTFSAPLAPGDYEVFYESERRGGGLPVNALARLGEFKVAMEDGAEKTALANVTTRALAGAIEFNGEKPPKSSYDHGLIYVRDPATEAVTAIGDTADGTISGVSVIDNEFTSYEVFYAADKTSDFAPANRWARLTPGSLTAAQLGDELASVSIETIDVTGAVTVDGEDPIEDPNNRGELLVGVDEDRATIGEIAKGVGQTLIKGSYGVYFRHEVSDGGLPVNTFGLLEDDEVTSDKVDALEFNVATTLVHGAITVRNMQAPDSAYADGRLVLRRGDDTVYLGNTRHGAFSKRIVRGGVYDLYYAVESTNGEVPGNHEVLLQSDVAIDGADMTLEIDVPLIHDTTRSVAVPDDVDFGGEGRYFLRWIDDEEEGPFVGGDEILVGSTESGNLDIAVAPGTYLLLYRVETPGLGTPTNEGAVLTCVVIGGEG